MIRRSICYIIGGVLFLNGAVLLLISNINVGYLAMVGLGVLLLLLGLFYSKIPRWIKGVFVAGLAVWFGFAAVLYGYGWADTVNYREDAVIVLGAGLKGDRPSKILRTRLDEAVEYHRQNPDAVMVVSGGQGPQETISEADAMARYLIAAGVPEEQILKEDRSTSTFENFSFSKALLDEKLGEEYSVAFVSNDFHILRAKGIAKQVGYGKTTHFHSNTPWYNVFSSGLRECLALVKFWVFKN